MDLTIIIPSFNTKDLLDRCLGSIYESIKSAKISVEIIVVDNSSTDGSRQLLEKKYPRVLSIFNKENVGFGRANNQAIKKAKGDFILLLNSDIQVLGNAIVSLYQFAAKNPHTFVGGKLLNEDKSSQSSCGPTFTLPVAFAVLLLRADLWGLTRSSPSTVKPVDWVSGACLIGTKNAFVDVGLFDEGVFMYMEEVEFLYRAKKKRHSVLFYPDAQFIHAGAASSGSRREPVLNIYRGLLYFYHKHMSIMDQAMLRVLLWLKAIIGITIGAMTGNKELKSTYEKALSMV